MADSDTVSQPMCSNGTKHTIADGAKTPSISSIKNKQRNHPRNAKRTNARKAPRAQKNARQTKIHGKGRNVPWQSTRKPTKLNEIMDEQSQDKLVHSEMSFYGDFMLNEEELLEQQMLLEAIAESKKSQSSQQNEQIEQNIEKPQKLDDEKSPETLNKQSTHSTETAITEAVNGDLDEMQCLSDEMFAIQLQKEEQRVLARNQKMSELYNGKHARVISSAVGPATLPKDHLNFYYDDDKLMASLSGNEEQDEDGEDDAYERESRHDPKYWNRVHVYRLNEYEMGGNLDADSAHFSHKAFNDFSNRLNKKGFQNFKRRMK